MKPDGLFTLPPDRARRKGLVVATLPEVIAVIGEDYASRLFGKTRRTMTAWRTLEHFPDALDMGMVIDQCAKVGFSVEYADIYGTHVKPILYPPDGRKGFARQRGQSTGG